MPPTPTDGVEGLGQARGQSLWAVEGAGLQHPIHDRQPVTWQQYHDNNKWGILINYFKMFNNTPSLLLSRKECAGSREASGGGNAAHKVPPLGRERWDGQDDRPIVHHR